jgi:hypothetical protein
MTLIARTVAASRSENATIAELSNPQVVTLAVYLAAGATKNVDTEHIAVQAHHLAPGRYRWKYYPEQIDIEKVAESLRDAQKARYGHLVQGARGSGWMLTRAGFDFARAHMEHTRKPDVMRAREEPWVKPERIRLLASLAHGLMQSGTPDAITSQELEAFFRIDDYVTGPARTRKIERLLNKFGDDPELGPTVRALAARIQKR